MEKEKKSNVEKKTEGKIKKLVNTSLCTLVTSFGLCLASAFMIGLQKDIKQPEVLDPYIIATMTGATVTWIGTYIGADIATRKIEKEYDAEIGKERHL